ncbi:MAG: MFS transporter [Spirochaetes bacterium]|nr:MFS transporter [Spirochaetota bacterium]
MEKRGLTLGEMSYARKKIYKFTSFNIISFTLLSGNAIILFSMRLDAGSFLVGLLSFFTYISYLCMLIGRSMVQKYGVVKLMGRFWFIRHLMMIPALLTPLIAAHGFLPAAHGLIALSVLSFNLFRGIAITGYNPILGEVVPENQRGAFLANLQKIHHTVTLAVGIAMALFLGRDAPLYRYTLFILIGIICGSYAAFVILKIPEPGHVRDTLSENLWKGFLYALKRIPFRKFIIIHFLISMASFMITPFLIVYVKKIYFQPDNLILIYTVFGSLGAILMALVSGFMIDRLGAKPLYFIFTCIITLALIPIILSPDMRNQKIIWIFSSAVFFFHYMGSHGILNSGQTYFFAAINPEERLNLGIVFFLARGFAGGIGALFGGIILEWLQNFYPIEKVFQIYFGCISVLFIFILILISKMENFGAYPIRNTLAIIFSPREIRAISLLNRLDKSRTISEEKSTIRALAASKSELSVYNILQKLKSPRYTIRKEALWALSYLPFDKLVIQSLISEVKNRTFTTAYLAADILGKKKIKEGIDILRKQLNTNDYFLCGKCMVSLARLGDRKSIPVIEDIIRKTSNPMLTIHSAAALEIFKNPASIKILLFKLRGKNPPYIRDEIILSIAGNLGIGDWFYPLYVSFLEKSSLGISTLKDYIDKCQVSSKRSDQLRELLHSLPLGNRTGFNNSADILLKQIHLKNKGVDISSIFREALMDINLSRLNRLCFLITAVIIGSGHLQPADGR